MGQIVAAWEIDRSLLNRARKEHAQIHAMSVQFEKYWDTPKRWPLIRKYYSIITPHILAGHRRSPYGLGIESHMTPIEDALWQEIRMMGLPFYMQYPVGCRFVDFGDPVYQIAIEADGAAYHDAERDAQKDRELWEEGWRVVRIKGRDSFRDRALSEIYHLYGMDHEAYRSSEDDDQ